LLAKTTTNESYLPGQLRFVAWCQHHVINPNHFVVEELINFLTTLHEEGFQLSTIKLSRSAVLVFHVTAIQFRGHPGICKLFRHWAGQAPPRPLELPVFDITPTLRYLATIDSSQVTKLSVLNSKTAFLLVMAAFLRLSDLHRIQLSQSRMLSDSLLSLTIVSPKERRGGRRIIKTLLIHPLVDNRSLCAVLAFKVLRDHPGASARPPEVLFVNSVKVESPLSCATIGAWLHRLLGRSAPVASSSGVPSVRSIASDLALKRGASLDDIITIGNWSSSTVFDQYYRRS
ncbi:hypothetical protein BDB00DRAFT_768881, partial [Zychaea mexicana]|uniref:uncharacterized protein n=1 Tax=Zychaea mexicana TaxID=64656 RepID=UPI0022FE048C